MHFEPQLQQSIQFLKSSEAMESLKADAYWPKWHSPWWHMLLLHEMGFTDQIPEAVLEPYITALNRIPLKSFPILPEDMPPGIDPYRGSPCHCQLGNVYQVLAARGVDVDRELPWIRPWFLQYQMADGGLNCANGAYLVKDECPSSMVGTIAAFEALLRYTDRPWTEKERAFIDKGARFLMERELRLGSPTKYNASERKSALLWTKLCFPRFYLYDVLRGLTALLEWAAKTKQPIPNSAIREVVGQLSEQFPDENLSNGRLSYAGAGTLMPSPAGDWHWQETATTFPLLSVVSAVGEVNPFLVQQWRRAQDQLAILAEKGLLT